MGRKVKEEVIQTGRFYCPRCGQEENYTLKNYNVYFHIFYIPLFTTKKLGQVLICNHCGTNYVPNSVTPIDNYNAPKPLNAAPVKNLPSANSGSYTGGYNGGHNNPNNNQGYGNNQGQYDNNNEYQSGNLYN